MDEHLTTEERVAVRKLVETVGDNEAAKTLSVNIESLLRILADRPIRRGTVALVREGLKQAKKK